MTIKKYLSLEEAADLLRLRADELLRLREKGDIRGFSDRGTWKFKGSDVDELKRRLQPDSSPEVAMLDDDSPSLAFDDDFRSPANTPRHDPASDSDVRLVFDDGGSLSESGDVLPLSTPISDSDVRLLGDDRVPISDSDVQLMDSSSDVSLTDDTSDSDVKIIGMRGSDSDVKLIDSGTGGYGRNVLDDEASALSDDDASSALFLGDSDLNLVGDSGVRLSPGSSGIQLTRPADSGILLEGSDTSSLKLADPDGGSSSKSAVAKKRKPDPLTDDELQLTSPLMPTAKGNDLAGTDPEVPMLFAEDDEEDSYSIPSLDDDKTTSVVMFDDDEEEAVASKASRKSGTASDSSLYDLDDEEAEFDDDLEVSDDLLGEDEELDELDAFETDDDDFSEEFATGSSSTEFVGGRALAQPEAVWGAGTVATLAVSTILMVIGAFLGADLLRIVTASSGTAADNGPLMGLFAGLFQ